MSCPSAAANPVGPSNLIVTPAAGVGSVTTLSALTSGIRLTLPNVPPAFAATVNVWFPSLNVGGDVSAFWKSHTVSILLIVVPVGSSMICSKSALAVAPDNEVRAVTFRSAI